MPFTERGNTFVTISKERRSMRSFEDKPIPPQIIKTVFGTAMQAPSNCNTQPWFVHIVTGELLETLREELPKRYLAGDVQLDIPYDGKYEGVFRERQMDSGRALYAALGIPREDKAARQEAFLENFRFFGAPAVAFFTLPTGFGLREACDLGMFAQSVMLGLTAYGLGSCPQTALGFFANVLRPALNLGDDEQLMFGLSFGYPKEDVPANEVYTDRAAFDDLIKFHQ